MMKWGATDDVAVAADVPAHVPAVFIDHDTNTRRIVLEAKVAVWHITLW